MAAVARWSGMATASAAHRISSGPRLLLLRHQAQTASHRTRSAQQALRSRTINQWRSQSTFAGHEAPRQRSLPVRVLRSTTSFLFMTLVSGALGMGLAFYFIPKPILDAAWVFTRFKRMTAAESIAQLDKELEADGTPETRAINSAITSHPLAQELRAAPDQWKESRPHMKIPTALRPTNLTSGTLAGPGRISVAPLFFASVDPKTGRHDGQKLVALIHLGPQLCGHPGIVHGGLLATLLDECLARCCFPALPNKMGVTANLQIDYRKPAMAAQPAFQGSGKGGGYFVLRAETTRVDGRKAWVKGYIEELPFPDTKSSSAVVEEKVVSNVESAATRADSASPDKKPKKKVVVEAEALFVEPRQAGSVKTLYADPD